MQTTTPLESMHEGRPTTTVLVDRCAGCQECVVRCPTGALDLDANTWTVEVNQELCVGCRQCERTCPFGAIVVEGPTLVAARVAQEVQHPAELEGDRSETRRGITSWAEALIEAERCLSCPDPTCVLGCPAHNDIPGFIRAVRDGDLDRAHEVLAATTFMPDVCSRVCDQALQCEGACSWSLAGSAPVAIGALERFVADNAPVPSIASRVSRAAEPPAKGLSVAIVGSGPAAIGAASELAVQGASVTVFERDAVPGGLLRWGIPDFTLPEPVARRPWDDLVAAGVGLRLESGLSPEEMLSLPERFDAVVVATGASVPIRPADTRGLAGIVDATEFLVQAERALASGSSLPLFDALSDAGVTDAQGPRVLVVGGGNTAMDVARSARRFGATVTCVDWMDRRFAPVRPDELEEAELEGVTVRFSCTVDHYETKDGRVSQAILARTEQASSKGRPRVLEGATEPLDVDLVVYAMGYRIDPGVADAGAGLPIPKTVPALPDRRWLGTGIMAVAAPEWARRQSIGRLALARQSVLEAACLPRQDRIWFAGDALEGPSTVVEAMTQGKMVARAIVHHRPLRNPAAGAKLRHVLVVTESMGGTTAAIGEQIAQAIADDDLEVRTVRVSEADTAVLAWADLIVFGTWVEGFLVAGVGPAKRAVAWLEGLPRLAGVKVATFCTYGLNPRGTLARIRTAFAGKGAVVVAEAAFSRSHRGDAINKFARRLRQVIDGSEVGPLAGRRTA